MIRFAERARRTSDFQDLAKTLVRWRFGNHTQRMHASHALLDRARRRIMPEYRLTDFGKAWWEDEDYFASYNRLAGNQVLTADRVYFLRELVKLVAHLDGDTAETGVYRGTSSWFICEARNGRTSTHWAFDSFQGLSAPLPLDGPYWHEGDLSSGPDAARRALEQFDARVLQGWIPEVFSEARLEKLVFAHIDVDLYAPTLASLEFFYPRTVSGGLIVCDDYGMTTCPGATRAFDEYMATRPEPIVRSPTGQAFIFKR